MVMDGDHPRMLDSSAPDIQAILMPAADCETPAGRGRHGRIVSEELCHSRVAITHYYQRC